MDAATSLNTPKAGIRLGWRVTPRRLTVVLILLTVALRIIGIGGRPLWLDEAYSSWFSSLSWHALWTEVPTYETHPPFYYSLLKLWRLLFGGSAVGLRLSSILLAATTVPVIFAACRELERVRPTGRPLLRAGMAAFLLACSPVLVLAGTEARPYPLLIFAYATAALAVLRLMREFAARGAGRWASWLMLAAATELGLWAHALGVLYATCLAGALAPSWLNGMSRSRLMRGASVAMVVTLLYLPCLLMMMGRAGDWGTGWIRWEPFMALQLIGLYSVPVEVLTVGSAIAALTLCLLIKRALEASFQTPGWNPDRAMLLLWWGPPLLAIVISQLGMPVFLPRTLTPTLVPAYLALSGALAGVPSQRERFALTAALVITLLPTGAIVALRPAQEAWDEVAAYLNRNVRPGDQIWVYPNDSALPLRYAGLSIATHGVPGDYPAVGIKGPIRAGSPAVVSVTAGQAASIVRDPSARAAPTVWLVTRQSGLFDPAGDMPRALAGSRRAGRAQNWDYIQVTPYARR